MTSTSPHLLSAPPLVRRAVKVRGAVQGVGFRPFVYRLATELGLTGWVLNGAQGLCVEVEGAPGGVDNFCRRLEEEAPPRALVQGVQMDELPPIGYTNFSIRHSAEDGPRTTVVLPDIATCPDCLGEIFDPTDRRYGYPFTNCTNCGPRYSIIRRLPYDRPHTSMTEFVMCPACQAEYDNPLDRRFHAQPNACPVCGPHLSFWDERGEELATRDDALRATGEAIRQGLVVAVKGLGGFHLLVDARNSAAIERLRRRKQRPDKPFAVMFPDLAQIQEHCLLSPGEIDLLESPAAPIVLVERRLSPDRAGHFICPGVAPANPTLGVFLPYTPLHHLLMRELNFPVVATSANLSDEPICTDNREALARLASIADYFLVHDRPIVRPVDDSVARILDGQVQILRRSRGYAPLPITRPDTRPDRWAENQLENAHSVAPPTCQVSVLAVGGHMKNTVALAVDGNVFLSQHLGDLENVHAFDAFQQAIDSLTTLYEAAPAVIVCDSHPDYPSARFAARLAAKRQARLVKVQHHHAHVLACIAENGLHGQKVLGVSWDGTGYGDDGTIWGGEFLLVQGDGQRRVAHLRPFRLPGGESAVREPRRTAIGLLVAAFGAQALDWNWLPPLSSLAPSEKLLLGQMIERGINAPWTTSMGRLFDGVAALLGLCLASTFEGQAAMALEFAAEKGVARPYPLAAAEATEDGAAIDWTPLLHALLTDISQGETPGHCAARFHSGLAELVVAVARHTGAVHVALSGGCFQNRLLSELTIERLRRGGFTPHWHRQVPPNDGGIALGQVIAGMSPLQKGQVHRGVAEVAEETRRSSGEASALPVTPRWVGRPFGVEEGMKR